MARRARLVVLLFLASVLLAPSAVSATPSEGEQSNATVAHTILDVEEAIYEWFPRHGIDPRVGVCVARKESGLDRFNDSSKYYGLFQHLKTRWHSRVRAYNAANDLKTPNADPYDPTTQALVSAWMVKNDGHWGQWPNTGRACGARTSRGGTRRR